MDKNNIIGIIADDLRQIYLAKYLSELGYSVQIITTENYDNIKYTINLEKCYFLSDIYDFIDSSNVIVTPIPFIKMNNLMNTLPNLRLLYVLQPTCLPIQNFLAVRIYCFLL